MDVCHPRGFHFLYEVFSYRGYGGGYSYGISSSYVRTADSGMIDTLDGNIIHVYYSQHSVNGYYIPGQRGTVYDTRD